MSHMSQEKFFAQDSRSHAIYLEITEENKLRSYIYRLSEDSAVVEYIFELDHKARKSVELDLATHLEELQSEENIIIDYYFRYDKTTADEELSEYKLYDKYVVAYADVISIAELAYAYYYEMSEFELTKVARKFRS